MDASTPKTHIVSKFGNEITESLRSRLEKLEQAAALATALALKDNLSTLTLEGMIKKTADKPGGLEMFRELAEEQPATDIRPQTVVNLLQRKITELKKALAVLTDTGH